MHQDNSQYYGTISRLLHWGMAACFTFMLFTAVMWRINEDYYSLMAYHKSVGFILMVLAVVRLLWTALNMRHRPESNIVVKLGHLALYALMVLVPAVALLRQYGSAKSALDVFGVTVLPTAPEKIEWMAQVGNQWHGVLAWTLFVLVAGHIVMAIVHQIKGEKIINRMAGPRR